MKYLLIIRYHLKAWSIWQPWPQMPWYLKYKRAERYFSSYDLHVTRCASTFEDSRMLHSYPCHTNSYASFCDSFLPANIYHHFPTRIKCKMDTIFRRHVQINMLVENILFYIYSCVCFLRPLAVRQHCFRKRIGIEQAPSHYLNKWWHILLTHISVTWLQWLFSLK